jgi:hypothetical protein
VQPSLARGFALEILDGKERLYARVPAYGARDTSWSRELAVEVANAHWTIRAWPTPEVLARAESTIPQILLVTGLFLSLLSGTACYLAQAASLRARTNERLKAGLETEVLERRRVEARLRQFNRLHAVSSHVSQAIVRLRDAQKLLLEVCKILVEDGCFRMAWVGFADQETLRIEPAVHWGVEDGYLASQHATAADEPAGQGPAGSAIRTGVHSL